MIEGAMVLVQWFFTVWVAGIPHEVGPFINEIQCENMVMAYMSGGPNIVKPRDYHSPAYTPVCSKREFVIEQKR